MGYFILFNILLNSYSQISPYGHVHDMDTPNRNQDSCNLFLCNNFFYCHGTIIVIQYRSAPLVFVLERLDSTE